MPADYSKSDLVNSLRNCGVGPGDVVFTHSNVGYFGRPDIAITSAAICALVVSAFQEVLGPKGTLIVPTFSYSFGSDRPAKHFDVAKTPSTCGILTEHVRKHPEALRSADPMFSIAAIRPGAPALTKNADPECFGENSFWRRFLDCEGKICNLNFDAGSTFIHFVERRLGVPYRKNRSFRGIVVENDKERPFEVTFFSRRLDDAGAAAKFEVFDALARESGYVKTAKVGRGAVVAISSKDTERLIVDTLPRMPRFLTAASNFDN